MPTYDQLWNKLLAYQPQLDALLAQRFINDAWREICDQRRWSFLIGNGWLYSPATINTGTASVTKLSASVTLNSAASTAVTGLSIPLITLRQFRVSGGPIYSIIGFDDTVPTAIVLTLDRLYMETTNAAATYTINRIYYGPPLDATGAQVTDFLGYKQVYDPVDAYSLGTNMTAEELDMADPQRASSGQPYQIASRGVDSSNLPLYEMWPSPSAERAYLALYQKRGADLTTGQSLPLVISDELMTHKALTLVCQWAEMQTDPRFRGINWRFIKADHQREFERLLRRAEIQDEEAMVQNLILPDNASLFPIDSAFMQSHAFPL